MSGKLDDSEAGYLKLLQLYQKDKNLTKNWIEEYIDNIKNPLYAVIMNVLAKADPDEILEVYKNMEVPKISESNREFLLDMIKKLELDKKLKEEGREEDAIKIAKKMINRGDSINDIADITELPKEKVIELKGKYQN